MGREQGAPWRKDSWSYWSGSWRAYRSPKNKGQDKDAAGSDATTFPGYSSMDVKGVSPTGNAPLALGAALETTAGSNADYLKLVQKSINNNRRIEGRLRKIAEETDHKHAQWRAFEKHVQESYLAQRKQYQTDVDALAKEVGDLERQRAEAMQQLVDVVEARQSREAPDAPMPAAPPQDIAAWRALVGEASDASAESDHGLAQALLAAQDPNAFARFLRERMQAPLHSPAP